MTRSMVKQRPFSKNTYLKTLRGGEGRDQLPRGQPQGEAAAGCREALRSTPYIGKEQEGRSAEAPRVYELELETVRTTRGGGAGG